MGLLLALASIYRDLAVSYSLAFRFAFFMHLTGQYFLWNLLNSAV
jgi:hypothetical protein